MSRLRSVRRPTRRPPVPARAGSRDPEADPEQRSRYCLRPRIGRCRSCTTDRASPRRCRRSRASECASIPVVEQRPASSRSQTGIRRRRRLDWPKKLTPQAPPGQRQASIVLSSTAPAFFRSAHRFTGQARHWPDQWQRNYRLTKTPASIGHGIVPIQSATG